MKSPGDKQSHHQPYLRLGLECPGLVPQLLSGVLPSSPRPSSTPQGPPSSTEALRKQANNQHKGVTQVCWEAGQQEQHVCQHALDLCWVLMDQGQNNLHRESKERWDSSKTQKCTPDSPGAKFISPMKLRLRKLELPNTGNTQFANSNLFRDGKSRSATAQPHRRLVQALTHSARPLDRPPAQHPLCKDSRQKPKVPHRGCCTIHLHVFKSYLLTTRRMLCWWQMRCSQALATRLFSPWVTRTLTLWSSLALLQ